MYEARRRILALGSETPPTICQTGQQLADGCSHLHNSSHSLLSSGNILFVAALQWKVRCSL